MTMLVSQTCVSYLYPTSGWESVGSELPCGLQYHNGHMHASRGWSWETCTYPHCRSSTFCPTIVASARAYQHPPYHTTPQLAFSIPKPALMGGLTLRFSLDQSTDTVSLHAVATAGTCPSTLCKKGCCIKRDVEL